VTLTNVKLNKENQKLYYTYSNFKEVVDYCDKIISGEKIANIYLKKACERFIADIHNDKFILKPKKPEWCINLIESIFINTKTDEKDRSFKLIDFQKFIIYNLTMFYLANNKEERRFHEAFIFMPRKQGKTTLIGAINLALSLLDIAEGVSCETFIVATKLKRAKESFDFILKNIENMGERSNFRVLDNNAEHSLSRNFKTADGIISMRIEAIANDTEKNDGILCPYIIADEVHAYKSANDYIVYKQATKSYSLKKMVIAITTAGTNIHSFCYERLEYCKKVLDKQLVDDQYFIFIAEADVDESGDIDYLNPKVHEMANPAYGYMIRPEDMMSEALQAQSSPSTRHLFLSKSLNVFTNSSNAWFDTGEVQYSDEQYNWTIDELAKLPITWYGGADLSVMYDLTAGVLYGRYVDEKKNIDVDIVVTHGFMPITQAKRKAEEDNIPFFYWQEQDWLTLCNGDVVNHSEVVKWFKMMRDKGFKIKEVAFDMYKSREFQNEMKQAKFKMQPSSQKYWMKSEAFREIERKIKKREFYYLHSKAFEYCISNVKGTTDAEDKVRYEKVHENRRMDLFDASVIACKSLIVDINKQKVNKEFFNQQL